jgi:hypothetical protein
MIPMQKLVASHSLLHRWSQSVAAAIAAFCISSHANAAPVPITGAGSYSQNFDTLALSGTGNAWLDDSTIVGWYSQRTGTGITYNADTGTGNAGALYSYGVASSTDRALGSLGSNNLSAGSFAHGVQLQNTSGSAVTINALSYAGEQWRKSGVTTAQVISLSYKISSSAITLLEPSTETGWTAVSAGDFSSPVNTTSAAALVGNDAANRAVISINPNITIPNGSYVMIRWRDPDHAGTDHGLAIDDFSVSWIPEVQPSLTLSASPSTVVENAGAAASTGTVSIPAALGADLTVSLASGDVTEATVPASVVITAGNTSATFPIDAVNDLLADGSQSVALTATATGYLNGATTLTVNDDTDAAILVSITPTSISEAAGAAAATGSVTLAAAPAADVTVNLASNDLTEATVPASVIITTGNTSATFPVDAVNDNDLDGTRSVRIDATATGYTGGHATISVTDDDVPTPPTLGPGAIAFTGFNADGNDDLAFVALVAIPANETIFFTDNEWNGAAIGAGGAFNTGEGLITWTAPASGVAAGTVVTLNSLSIVGRSTSVGSVTGSGSFNLGGSAETVYAYQGTASSTLTAFLAVIATHAADSTVGTGLDASHIINLTVDVDIAAYTGLRNNKTTYAGYLASFANSANWITQDGTGDQSGDTTAPDVPFDTTVFTLATATGYDSWNDNLADQTADQDYDGDGLDNGTEYFMGTLGNAFTANPGVVAGKVTWPRAAGTTIGAWRVEVSSDLTTWTDATVTYPGSVDTTTDTAKVVFTMPTTPTAPDKVFVRLSVTP